MQRQKTIQWRRLDNAAKIFPSTSGKKDTKVFRFACELNEPVDCVLLQKALDETIVEFPTFQCILRRGLFWYYFEETAQKPVVIQESKAPCGRLYYKSKKTLFFEVTYFKKRINLEVHHILTDGTGAMEFLKALVYRYLYMKHAGVFQNSMYHIEKDASFLQKEDDSFQRYYTKEKKGVKNKNKVKKAYKLKGRRYSENRVHVIEGVMPVKQLLEQARKYNTTVSVFITAAFICSIGKELSMLQKKRPVVVAIPVNLRNFFPSESVRNFFSVFHVSYDFSKGPGEFEDVLERVKQGYKQGLDVENLKQRLNTLASLEHNVLMRMIPLIVKDIVLKTVNYFSDYGVTASVSNIGKITMREEFKEYINLFDIFISTRKIQICFCSYEKNLVLSFTSPFISAEIQKNFFRMMSQRGISVEITANPMNGS